MSISLFWRFLVTSWKSVSSLVLPSSGIFYIPWTSKVKILFQRRVLQTRRNFSCPIFARFSKNSNIVKFLFIIFLGKVECNLHFIHCKMFWRKSQNNDKAKTSISLKLSLRHSRKISFKNCNILLETGVLELVIFHENIFKICWWNKIECWSIANIPSLI